MEFKIGCGLLRARLDEGAQLRRCHRQRAAAKQRVLQADHGLAPQAVGHGVKRAGVADLEGHAQLQMVLQVAANAGQVMHHRDAVLLQQCTGPDA